jgi:HSP20 family protein
MNFCLTIQEHNMDYIKIRFSDDFTRTGIGFEKTIGEMFQTMSPMFMLSERSWKPPMDIYETSEEIIILAEIAGVAKEDLDIEINDKAVKISGKRRLIFSTEETRYRLAEIQYGRFERVLFLPAPIDMEVVSASYANGFLQIRMAKRLHERTLKIPIE